MKHWPSRTPRQGGTVSAWMLDADEVEAIWQALRELRPDDFEGEAQREAAIRIQRRFEPSRRRNARRQPGDRSGEVPTTLATAREALNRNGGRDDT